MMQIDISGKVLKVGDVVEYSGGFSKAEIVVEISEDEKYSSPVPVEFVKEKAELIEGLKVGSTVKVRAYLRGSYWEKGDRYFLSLAGYSCDVDEAVVTEDKAPGKEPAGEKETGDFPF
jgi:hypothetical protein